MKWKTKKVKNGWGIFLLQKFCKTDEPVCYGVAKNKLTAQRMTKRLNESYDEGSRDDADTKSG
jgi:hypothetical protein